MARPARRRLGPDAGGGSRLGLGGAPGRVTAYGQRRAPRMRRARNQMPDSRRTRTRRRQADSDPAEIGVRGLGSPFKVQRPQRSRSPIRRRDGRRPGRRRCVEAESLHIYLHENCYVLHI